MNKGAFLDLDKTLYDGYLFYPWIIKLAEEGLFNAAILAELEEKLLLYKIGQESYLQAAKDVAFMIGELLKNKGTDEIIKQSQSLIGNEVHHYYEYTVPLIGYLKAHGYLVILVSNEPDFLTEPIRQNLNCEGSIGLEYEVRNAKFTGRLNNDLYSSNGKATGVQRYAKAQNIDLGQSIAIGDSEGDIEMLRTVHYGVLVRDHGKKAPDYNPCVDRETIIDYLENI